MKRFLFCLAALVGVMVLIVPAYAVEMKINGIERAKFYATDNMDGDKDSDDSRQGVKQRLRLYFTSVASENLKMVYKNEIDFNWGDESFGVNRGKGGGLGGDNINLETKNVYLEMMVPDTPVQARIGLQGIALHKGWWIDDDASALRFDMNFDPVSVMLAWVLAVDTDQTSSSDDIWQLHASVGYKAENMDGRLSLGYEKGPNDTTSADVPESDDFYQIMGEFSMSFDLVNFYVIAAKNFGEVKSDGPGGDLDYKGYMFDVGVGFALDMATLRARFFLASGDDEGDFEDDYRSFSGQTFSWAEIPSDGYMWEINSSMAQIGGANTPSNVYTLNLGADFKPTDTTTINADIWYIAMMEDRTVGGEDEDEIGTEVDLKVTQKVYDNLDVLLIGSYMFAENGYGNGGGDDGWILAMGMNYSF